MIEFHAITKDGVVHVMSTDDGKLILPPGSTIPAPSATRAGQEEHEFAPVLE